MVLNFNSDNKDYRVVLAKYDPQAGNLTGTNIALIPGNQIVLRNLDEGSYGLYVCSKSSVGNSYTLNMNALNPNSTSSDKVTGRSDLSIINIIYSNGNVYQNGRDITPETETLTASQSTEHVIYGTQAKTISGYLKDINGNPISNRKIFIQYSYDAYFPKQGTLFTANFFDIPVTDSDGYYSTEATESGHYMMYSTYNDIGEIEGEKIINKDPDAKWPTNSKWIINSGEAFYTSYYNVREYIYLSDTQLNH